MYAPVIALAALALAFAVGSVAMSQLTGPKRRNRAHAGADHKRYQRAPGRGIGGFRQNQ